MAAEPTSAAEFVHLTNAVKHASLSLLPAAILRLGHHDEREAGLVGDLASSWRPWRAAERFGTDLAG